LEQKIGTDPANKHYDAGPQGDTDVAAERAVVTTSDETPEHGSTAAEAEEEGMYL
jgi:hypothetical protein